MIACFEIPAIIPRICRSLNIYPKFSEKSLFSLENHRRFIFKPIIIGLNKCCCMHECLYQYKHSCIQQITFITYDFDFVQQQKKRVRAMCHFYFLFHRGPNVSKSHRTLHH